MLESEEEEQEVDKEADHHGGHQSEADHSGQFLQEMQNMSESAQGILGRACKLSFGFCIQIKMH